MKYQDIKSPVSESPEATIPNFVDTDFSVDKIQEAKAAMAELAANPKYSDAMYKASFARVDATLDIATRYCGLMMNINSAMAVVSKASKAADLVALDDAYKVFNELMSELRISESARIINRKTKYNFKRSNDYVNKMKAVIERLQSFTNAIKKRMVELTRTPAQNAAAKAASARMQARWYE